MTAEFISRHIAWTLPESLYDLADMDDSTPGGRRFLMCLILAHAAVASYLAGVLAHAAVASYLAGVLVL